MTTFWAAVFLFGLLIFFHEFGHFIFAKLLGVKVLKFSLGFGPKLVSKKIGDTEYILSAVPLGGYVKPLGEEAGEEIKDEDKPMAFNYQPVWKRAAIVLAGPVFNLILAYFIFVVFLSVNIPIAIPDINSVTTAIEDVAQDSPAMHAGLRKGDEIVSINGAPVNDWNEMAEMFSKHPGQELSLKVKRNNSLMDMKVTPEPTKIKNEKDEEITIGRIGISKQLDFKVIESGGVVNTPLHAVRAVYEWSVLTLKIVGKLLTGGVAAKQIGGPILIIDAAAKAASAGVFTYFNFIAIISINLAVFNLLPVPVLDGGHLMFLSIEAIRGKALSEKVMMTVTKAGIALLILLITFVFYNDTVRVIVPWIKRILENV